ncbi:hypothetical protein [Microbacterium capsulatum]|uniref:S1 motif domain-containing protein n=1 Tax=Microbacterium capsulatum TaxID=3041921 RepID=A0ABU0XBZ3_9MICO|nr:hypothetical protein [Microbacterium sp. ASV81]MDQ4212482.1 hypothetical protein [Microbacterium sp. ASV81]
MDDQVLEAGDVISAVVTKALPFGVLVEYAGVPGLARGVQAEPGVALDVRVLEFDATLRRFSAEIV